MNGMQLVFEIVIALFRLMTGNQEQAPVRPLSPAMRQEVRKLDETLKQYKLLCENHIDSPEELASFIEKKSAAVSDLEDERRLEYNRCRRPKSDEDKERHKAAARAISAELNPLRDELATARKIVERYPKLLELLETERAMEQQIKITLPTPEALPSGRGERVSDIPLDELHPFKDHPFRVQNNEELERMVESIRKLGAITPALARPLPDGSYELISGHRRLEACRQAGLEAMPVIVRDMTDDEAVITMVDANLQREHILPSEKAFAYKMKRDALTHQGSTSPQVGEKQLTVEKIGADGGDSKNQVLRYIRLTHLIPELLQMVDEGKIAFTPAVELSYLLPEEQKLLLAEMEYNDCTPNLSQAQRLKELSNNGGFTAERLSEIMGEEKANQKERIKIPAERVRKFFPKSYTTAQMEDEIVKLCEAQYRKRMRDRDAR
jgi:ParB family chromosome partitioning protein